MVFFPDDAVPSTGGQEVLVNFVPWDASIMRGRDGGAMTTRDQAAGDLPWNRLPVLNELTRQVLRRF
jgi:hypothetical protein